MKAITTTYHGPTNTRGARISADDGDNRVYISYPYELNQEEAHKLAAQTLCDKLHWKGTRATGGTKTGYVHVFIECVDSNCGNRRNAIPLEKETR